MSKKLAPAFSIFKKNKSYAKLCYICVALCQKRFFEQIKIRAKIPKKRFFYLRRHFFFVEKRKLVLGSYKYTQYCAINGNIEI